MSYCTTSAYEIFTQSINVGAAEPNKSFMKRESFRKEGLQFTSNIRILFGIRFHAI